MPNRHALAGKAGALLFEKADRRFEALLAEHGAPQTGANCRAPSRATYFGAPLLRRRLRTFLLPIFMHSITAPDLLRIRRLSPPGAASGH